MSLLIVARQYAVLRQKPIFMTILLESFALLQDTYAAYIFDYPHLKSKWTEASRQYECNDMMEDYDIQFSSTKTSR